MAKKATQKQILVGSRVRAIPAFSWDNLTREGRAAAVEQQVLLVLSQDQWQNMAEDRRIQSDLCTNLREELRVANLKLRQLEERTRDKDIEHMHCMEKMRSELSEARKESKRQNDALHALVNVL